KPELGTAPSNLAIMGRYVLTPAVFDHLDKQEIGAGGEIQLTDAIQAVNEQENVYAYDFEGERYDVGEKCGFGKTTIELALQNDEIKDELKNNMREVIKRANNMQSKCWKERLKELYKIIKRCVDFIISIAGMII